MAHTRAHFHFHTLMNSTVQKTTPPREFHRLQSLLCAHTLESTAFPPTSKSGNTLPPMICWLDANRTGLCGAGFFEDRGVGGEQVGAEVVGERREQRERVEISLRDSDVPSSLLFTSLFRTSRAILLASSRLLYASPAALEHRGHFERSAWRRAKATLRETMASPGSLASLARCTETRALVLHHGPE